MPRGEIQALRKQHQREQFACGDADLDRYLQRFARQSQRRGATRVFVAVEPGERRVLGYHALSANVVAFAALPPERSRGLPGEVPAVLLGRLAVDRSAQGQGLGQHLLMDALHRVVQASSEIGIHAVVIDAAGEAARRFYEHFGFEALLDDPLHLFLAIKAVREAFEVS